MHRGAFCQFPFRWIYYYDSNKSTGKETGKTHLCAVIQKNSSLADLSAKQCRRHWIYKMKGTGVFTYFLHIIVFGILTVFINFLLKQLSQFFSFIFKSIL